MPDKTQIEAVPAQSVGAAYIHYDKEIEPKQELSLAGRRLKWYDIFTPGEPVPPAIHLMARDFLEKRAGAGEFGQLGDLGFVILHRCGADFYFLLVCSWTGNQELWESVYAKDGSDSGFRDFPLPGPHRGTYCVWEMGAVWHEQQAWRRFLFSDRSEMAVAAWLKDQYKGPV